MSKAEEWAGIHAKIVEEVKREQERLRTFQQDTLRFVSAFGMYQTLTTVAEVDRDGSLHLMHPCNLSPEEAIRLGKWLIGTFGD